MYENFTGSLGVEDEQDSQYTYNLTLAALGKRLYGRKSILHILSVYL